MNRNSIPETPTSKSPEEARIDIQQALFLLEQSLAADTTQTSEDDLTSYRAEDRRILNELITKSKILDGAAVVLTVGEYEAPIFTYGSKVYDLNQHTFGILPPSTEIRLNWTDHRIAPTGMPDIAPGYEAREMFAGYKSPDSSQTQAIPFASIQRTIQEGGSLRLMALDS